MTVGKILCVLLVAASPVFAAAAQPLADTDMEQPGLGPWEKYGTPTTLAKSDFARTGRQSLHVVTDNKDTVYVYEGVVRSIGDYQAGDVIQVSFWFNVKAGQAIIAGVGQTSFLSFATFPGTDWTRASLSLRCPKAGRYTLWISQAGAPADFFIDDLTLDVRRRANLGFVEPGQEWEMTSGPMNLLLCSKTGALAGIRNNITGRVAMPTGKRCPLVGLELLSADGQSCEAVPYDQLTLKLFLRTGPRGVVMRFTLVDLPIDVTMRVELGADGAATFTGKITNRSDRTVTGCEYPILMDLDLDADPSKVVLVHPDQCGRIEPNAIKGSGCQTSWPGRGVMGWMDLSGEKSGLYLATHDRSLTGTRMTAVPTSDRTFDMSLTRELVVPPKGQANLPPAVVAIHPGDWHASADRYRAWMQSWLAPPKSPPWIRDANGWVLVGLMNDIPFRRLPDYYREAQWMGMEYLQVHGQGIDWRYEDKEGKVHDLAETYLVPSPRLGGAEELKKAVGKVHQMGGHVTYYFLYDRWRPALSLADDMGTGKRSDIPKDLQPPPLDFYYQNALVENPGGKLPTEHPFGTERFMCLASPGWQDWMVRWAKLYATEYGSDGFYWDVMGRSGPSRCFNPRHNHEGQNAWAAGSRQVLARTLADGLAVDKDTTCAIEGCSDVLGDYVGFHMMSGATMTPNVFRYTFPSYLCVDGFSNHYWKMTQPEKARRVFLEGERFDIHGYQHQVKPIIDLRRRIKPFIDWPAVFKDTVGLAVSDPRVEARAFHRLDGRNKVIAVTLLNEQSVEGATVEVDLSPIGPAKTVHLFGLDGRLEKLAPGAGDRQILRVPKDRVSAAVLVAEVSPELAAVPWIEQIPRPGEDGAVLSVFQPAGPVRGLAWKVGWPKGFVPEEKALPAESDCLRRIAFHDPARLAGLTRWERVAASVTWPDGQAEAWTMLCPPLVNGGFEEVEDGWLVYWPAQPCFDNPGRGKACIKLDRQTAPKMMLISLAPLKPNCRYRFKAMVKRTGAQWAGAHVLEYLDNANFARSAALNSTKRGEWETLETTFTTQSDPRTTAVYLYNYDPDNPVYYDGLELEEVR